MGTWRKGRESRARPLSPSYVGKQQLYIGTIYIAAGEWDGLHRRIRVVVVVVEPSIRSESEQRKTERDEGRERKKRRKEREEILAAVTREGNGNDTWKNGLKIRG